VKGHKQMNLNYQMILSVGILAMIAVAVNYPPGAIILGILGIIGFVVGWVSFKWANSDTVIVEKKDGSSRVQAKNKPNYDEFDDEMFIG